MDVVVVVVAVVAKVGRSLLSLAAVEVVCLLEAKQLVQDCTEI